MPSTLPAPNALSALTASYRIGTINQKQQKALLIVAKIWQLKNDAGQTDYTANHRQLAIDAEAACKGMQRADLEAAQVGQAWAIAKAIAGAPQTLNQQLATLGNMVNRSDDELDRINLLLEYLLQQATGD